MQPLYEKPADRVPVMRTSGFLALGALTGLGPVIHYNSFGHHGGLWP